MSDLPKAVFFDMDGTILDWQSNMDETWRIACEAGCDGSDVDALYNAILGRRTWFWSDRERANAGRMDLEAASRRIVEHALEDLGRRSPELAASIAEDYRARRRSALAPYPGAIETLEVFRARGVPMALITNGAADAQRRSIERFSLAAYFNCIVIEGEFGLGKPDERVFQHALASCDVAPGSAWMVGDNLDADIAPAVALGLHAVWVDAESAGLPGDSVVRPHRTVRTISELLAES